MEQRGRRSRCRLLLAAALLCAAPAVAEGQAMFVFRAPPSKDAVEWTGTAQLGASASSGNARALGVTGQAKVARTDRRFRLSADSELAYARSRIDVVDERDGVSGIGPGELREVVQTTRQAWSIRTRADRFLSPRTALFALVRVGGDRPAGKLLTSTGQLGFGVDVVRSPPRQVRLEIAYDFTREKLVVDPGPLEIHSGRLFASYVEQVSDRLHFEISSEAISNVSREVRARGAVGLLGDTRLVQATALTYKLNDHLSVAARAKAAYDTAPPPRPPPPGTVFEPGFAPAASRWDTTADLVAIFGFL